MSGQIPTDPAPEHLADVPAELTRPIEDRIADSIAAKAARLAEMRGARDTR